MRNPPKENDRLVKDIIDRTMSNKVRLRLSETPDDDIVGGCHFPSRRHHRGELAPLLFLILSSDENRDPHYQTDNGNIFDVVNSLETSFRRHDPLMGALGLHFGGWLGIVDGRMSMDSAERVQ